LEELPERVSLKMCFCFLWFCIQTDTH